MTKRERAQVVELLRCAADTNDHKRGYGLNGLFGAGDDLGYQFRHRVNQWAWDAKRDAQGGRFIGDLDYCALLLEAALRVEQGEWP